MALLRSVSFLEVMMTGREYLSGRSPPPATSGRSDQLFIDQGDTPRRPKGHSTQAGGGGGGGGSPCYIFFLFLATRAFPLVNGIIMLLWL